MTAVLQKLGELSRLVTTAEPREVRARAAAEAIRKDRGYLWVGLFDVEFDTIRALAWTGAGTPPMRILNIDDNPIGEAVRTGEIVNHGEVVVDARFVSELRTPRSEIVVPCLGHDGRVRGTINVESDRMYAFGPEEVEFLEACAQALMPLWA